MSVPAVDCGAGGRHDRGGRQLRRRVPVRGGAASSEPERSARLGALAAAEVVSHLGARPQHSLAGHGRGAGRSLSGPRQRPRLGFWPWLAFLRLARLRALWVRLDMAARLGDLRCRPAGAAARLAEPGRR